MNTIIMTDGPSAAVVAAISAKTADLDIAVIAVDEGQVLAEASIQVLSPAAP